MWEIKEYKKELYEKIKGRYHKVIAKMLAARYDTVEQIDEAMKLVEYDPFLYRDMKKTVNLLRSARKVFILTDFDCDGIGSNAVLSKGFDMAGIDYEQQTGSRSAGYGFHPQHVDTAISKGCDVIITADVGIAANDTVDYAKSKGLKVIITDHHEVKKENGVPNADAVIDPKVPGETYPFKKHAGVGVAYKVIKALNPHLDENIERELIEIVTLSTITDVAELVGENRYWVRKGLKYLESPYNLGLRELGYLQGLQDEVKKNGYISPRAIGFGIGPCFNANSRIRDNGEIGRNLLCSNDPDLIKVYAHELFEANKERKKIQDKMVRKAKSQTELLEDRIIVIADKDFHPAVCGICASKIVDKTAHPTIILTDGDVIKGSARSNDKINLFKVLESIDQSLFKGWGGHEAAAGLTLNCDVDTFRKAVNEAVKDYPEDMFEKTVVADSSIELDELSYPLLNELEDMRPFGQGNPRPTFYTIGKTLGPIRFIESKKEDIDEKHISFWVSQPGNTKMKRKCIGWFLGDQITNKNPAAVEIMFKPSLTKYTGRDGVQRKGIELVVTDIKTH